MHCARRVADVRRVFRGALVSPQEVAGIRCERMWIGWQESNSGAALLGQAAQWRLKRVVLLRYDCQHTGGQAHWHGDHPAGLGNAGSVGQWLQQFEALRPATGWYQRYQRLIGRDTPNYAGDGQGATARGLRLGGASDWQRDHERRGYAGCRTFRHLKPGSGIVKTIKI